MIDVEFSILTDTEINKYRIHRPNTLFFEKEIILGCKIDGAVCAYAALERSEEEICVNDFFVKEDCRGKGIGTALLNEICNHVMEKTKKKLRINYKQEAAGGLRLEGMLVRRGFRISAREVMNYIVDLNMLEESELGRIENKPSEIQESVFSLQAMSAQQLKELVYRSEAEGNTVVSKANFLSANRKRSKMLLIEGKIKGIILLEDTEEVGVAEITLLYIEPKYIKRGFFMMREAFCAVKEPGSGIEKIRFVCVNKSAKKLAKYLFPKAKGHGEWIAQATLNRELYRKRG